MKILYFKFHKNHPINEEFDFFEGGGGERRAERPRDPIQVFFFNFYIKDKNKPLAKIYFFKTKNKLLLFLFTFAQNILKVIFRILSEYPVSICPEKSLSGTLSGKAREKHLNAIYSQEIT